MVGRRAASGWVRAWRALLEPSGLLLAAVLVLAPAAMVQPMFDPDFWWHLRVGLEILATGIPQHNFYTYTAFGHVFIIQEWGTEALFGVLYPHVGMLPVLLLFGALSWVGLLLGLRRAHRPGGSRAALAVGGALWILASLQIWGPRSQMFTFAFAAVLLVLLDHHRRRGGRLVFLSVPLVALWGNLHGGFLFGLGVFAVVLLAWTAAGLFGGDAPALQGSRLPWPAWRAGVAAFVLAALAAMVNPNGVAVYRYPLELLTSHIAQKVLQEWQSPDFHQHAMWPFLILIVTALLVAGAARRTALHDWLLAGAGLVLALDAVRNIPLFGLLVVPLWVDGAAALLGTVRRRAGSRTTAPGAPTRPAAARRARAAIAGVVVVACAAVSAARIVEAWRSPQNSPTSSVYAEPVARLLCHGPTANVFTPYGAAGWLLFQLDHRQPAGRTCATDRVFIFGEVNVMGARNLARYLVVASGGPGAARILAATHSTVVWQGRTSPLVARLARDRRWRCIFADHRDVVFAAAATAGRWPTDGSQRAACPA